MTPPAASRRQSGPGQLAFLLAQLGGLAAMRFAERLAPLGLSPPQAGLLRAIDGDAGRSQQAVAAQLGLLPSRLVALIDELERDGLVERRQNPADRRHHALYLTADGEQRLRDIGRVATEHGADYFASLDDHERTALAELLGKLATQHGLAPGVHPAYRMLGADSQAGRVE
ncbi:MAG: MarR family transcriptional regulator [Actinomycetota bacterium]|nr:MAG: MarR family transcriptional regulator [Actinomycetota bacterium]